MKFDKGLLVAEQKKYATNIVNAYSVYELDKWPKIPLDNVTLTYCLFGATNITKISNKGKWDYSGYGIVFGGKDSWSFGNDFARNVVL